MRQVLVLLCLCLPLAAQDFADYKLVRVAEGFTFTQGPAWSPEGHLLFSDIPSSRIWKLETELEPELYREDDAGTNGMAFDSRGRLYTCDSRSRVLSRTNTGGRIVRVAEGWEGKRLNSWIRGRLSSAWGILIRPGFVSPASWNCARDHPRR